MCQGDGCVRRSVLPSEVPVSTMLFTSQTDAVHGSQRRRFTLAKTVGARPVNNTCARSSVGYVSALRPRRHGSMPAVRTAGRFLGLASVLIVGLVLRRIQVALLQGAQVVRGRRGNLHSPQKHRLA